MAVEFILLAIAAYLLGSVPAGYLAIKWTKHTDIRKIGTGKVGASNVLSSGSKLLAVPVAIFDLSKGMAPVLVAQALRLDVRLEVTVGLLAIVGHNWPVYLKFKGSGRGILTSLGVITALSWKLGIIVLVLSYAWAPFKQLALGVFIGLCSLPFFSWFLTDPLGISDKTVVTFAFVALTMLALGKRLVAHRSELSKGKPWGYILINRLLFDRDIWDGRLWTKGAADGVG
jgi:glycerol-3-phosphate acyltransferase PlsY